MKRYCECRVWVIYNCVFRFNCNFFNISMFRSKSNSVFNTGNFKVFFRRSTTIWLLNVNIKGRCTFDVRRIDNPFNLHICFAIFRIEVILATIFQVKFFSSFIEWEWVFIGSRRITIVRKTLSLLDYDVTFFDSEIRRKDNSDNTPSVKRNRRLKPEVKHIVLTDNPIFRF